MNNPIIESTSAISGGRPETVAPNTTSLEPEYRLSNTDHAPWTKMLRVKWRDWANRCNDLVASSERSSEQVGKLRARSAATEIRSTPSDVGLVKPSRLWRQNEAAASSSCRTSHSM